MKVWIVTDRDYDDAWIVAVYPAEEMAEDHIRLMGGYVECADVRSALHPDAIDPTKQAERSAAKEKEKQLLAERMHQAEASEKLVQALRPDGKNLRLCHCQTFSLNLMWTPNGYCRYCGGWAPEVVKKHCGIGRVQEEIDKLAIHDREKMKVIVGQLSGNGTED